MIKAEANRTTWRIVVGIVLLIAAMFASFDPGEMNKTPFNYALVLTAMCVELIAAILFIWGCCLYARAKGYWAALGMIGLVPLIGLFAICVLPDLRKNVA